MKYTLQEWQEEGKRRFGVDVKNWKFICPACGRTNTGHDFSKAGATPDDLYTTCIGRHNGKGVDGMGVMKSKRKPSPEHGCNWAAFGLFGTLNSGDIVINKDGAEIAVFSFAPGEEQHG